MSSGAGAIAAICNGPDDDMEERRGRSPGNQGGRQRRRRGSSSPTCSAHPSNLGIKPDEIGQIEVIAASTSPPPMLMPLEGARKTMDVRSAVGRRREARPQVHSVASEIRRGGGLNGERAVEGLPTNGVSCPRQRQVVTLASQIDAAIEVRKGRQHGLPDLDHGPDDAGAAKGDTMHGSARPGSAPSRRSSVSAPWSRRCVDERQ